MHRVWGSRSWVEGSGACPDFCAVLCVIFCPHTISIYFRLEVLGRGV